MSRHPGDGLLAGVLYSTNPDVVAKKSWKHTSESKCGSWAAIRAAAKSPAGW